MKKTFLILGLILIITITKTSEKVIIPDEAIRFRVIANSNSNLDQTNKKKIAKKLSTNISTVLRTSNSIDDARIKLKENIPTFKAVVSEEAKKENYDIDVDVNYGNNYFPEKHYKGVTYKEGNYELAKRLQSTGFFENAFLLDNSRIQGIHMYLRNATEGKKHITLINSLKNSLNEIKHIVFSKIKGKGYAINNKMILGGTMDFSQYDSVFCLDKRQLVVDCVQEILKATEQKCKINLLDEGTSTYWRSILTKNFPISEIFLMAPQLANYFHEGWENRINTIPAININDDKFRNIINYVFAFEDDGHYLKNKNGL